MYPQQTGFFEVIILMIISMPMFIAHDKAIARVHSVHLMNAD